MCEIKMLYIGYEMIGTMRGKVASATLRDEGGRMKDEKGWKIR